MRFMMMVKADKNYEAGIPPKPELLAAIGKLTDDMVKAGVLVQTGGLLPSSTGARIHVSRGKLSVTDGPFAETKELVGGYAIVEAASRDEAIQLGRRFMELHAAVLGPSYDGECEVRQLFDGSGCSAMNGDDARAQPTAQSN
jgi:hypothetical protein